MFRATNLRQSRKFYASAAADAGDIKKVWSKAEAFQLQQLASAPELFHLSDTLMPCIYGSSPEAPNDRHEGITGQLVMEGCEKGSSGIITIDIEMMMVTVFILMKL